MFVHPLRAALAAGLLLPLAACVVGDGGATGAAKPSEPLRRVAFFGGDVVVAGPPGYCIDPKSVQSGPRSGFALMASCGHLTGSAWDDVPPAVITVSVLARDDAAKAPTAARIAVPWANAGVLQQIDGKDVALIHLARGGDAQLPDGDPHHWRGAMAINHHLIGLAAYGGAGSAIAGARGRAVLTDTARAMRAASPDRPTAPAGS